MQTQISEATRTFVLRRTILTGLFKTSGGLGFTVVDIIEVLGDKCRPLMFWFAFAAGSDKTLFNVKKTMVTTDESSDELNVCEGKWIELW